MTDRERIVEAMRMAISKPLANMQGGCFRPDGRSQRNDCADGDCYCARVGHHCATAALAAIPAVMGWVAVAPGARDLLDRHGHEEAARLLRALAEPMEAPRDGR